MVLLDSLIRVEAIETVYRFLEVIEPLFDLLQALEFKLPRSSILLNVPSAVEPFVFDYVPQLDQLCDLLLEVLVVEGLKAGQILAYLTVTSLLVDELTDAKELTFCQGLRVYYRQLFNLLLADWTGHLVLRLVVVNEAVIAF